MKSNKTCLPLLLALLTLTPQVGAVSKLDFPSSITTRAAGVPSSRMFGTALPGRVIYWRAGSFTPATTWDDLAAESNAMAPTARGLILDLRSNVTPADFVGAARVSSLLAPQSAGVTKATTTLITNGVSLNPSAMLVVLVNRKTCGAAQSLAATLRSRGALIMGEETNTASGIVPDVTTTANAQDEAAALAMIDRQQVHAVITEAAIRHRVSEASLVRGQNPEEDVFIASHEQDAPSAETCAHDVALVEALDSFKAIRVLQSEESSPQPRLADISTVAGLTVIASSGLR